MDAYLKHSEHPTLWSKDRWKLSWKKKKISERKRNNSSVRFVSPVSFTLGKKCSPPRRSPASGHLSPAWSSDCRQYIQSRAGWPPSEWMRWSGRKKRAVSEHFTADYRGNIPYNTIQSCLWLLWGCLGHYILLNKFNHLLKRWIEASTRFAISKIMQDKGAA